MSQISPYIQTRKNALHSLVLLICFIGFSSISPPADPDKLEKFKQTFKNFINDPALAHASVGFALIDTETGKAVLEHNPNLSLIPASTMKIITTGAALGILGEDYTFKTQLAYSGTVDSGTLKGNIYIIGGGDPVLGSSRISETSSMKSIAAKWVDAIKHAGILQINGAIIADATHFEYAMQPPNWAWNDIGNYYGAGASGLSFNENCYTINLVTTPFDKDKLIVNFKVMPEIKGLVLGSELKPGPGSKGENAYIFGAPYNFNHFIRGTIVPNATVNIKGSIPDPPLFCAQYLEDELKKAGIFSKLETTSTRFKRLETQVKAIYEYSSPKLTQIVNATNMNSINLYAETLLKECGYKVFNDGSTESGIKAVMQFWKNKGVDVNGLFMHDGSGLSHSNAVTANQLAQILSTIKKEKYLGSFYNSLPVAGESGAMRNMGNGTAIDGKMRAKSGHMDRIRSYAGYTSADKKYAFALHVNNYSCESWEIKGKIEKVLAGLGF